MADSNSNAKPVGATQTDAFQSDPLSVNMVSETYLGFDFGIKKIGVAVGQMATNSASPLTILPSVSQNPDWSGIGQLIVEWRPAGLVVGLSRRSDGSDNPITPRIMKFSRQLEGRFQLPVFLQDETLSTYEAKQMLFDDLGTRAKTLWRVQDQLAAQLVLQSWLNDNRSKACP